MKIFSNKYIKAGVWSAVLSVLFLFLIYVYWNMPYTYGTGDDFILKMSMIRDLAIEREFDDSKIVPVNVAYDKMLIPHLDPRDNTVAGVRAITDRGKLLTFLKMLKQRDKYEYIFCDIRFDDYQTEYDEELFATIASMRDIVVASSNLDKVPEQLKDKAAMSFYSARIVGDDFMKYNYILDDGTPNIALRIWEETTGGTMKKKWLRYSMNDKCCVRSIIPDFRYSIYDDIADASDRKSTSSNVYSSKIYNLGAQVVEPYNEGYTSGKFFDDKFIMIGDFTENDLHSTISGEQPGPVIVYNAFLALMNEDNVIPLGVYLLLFVTLWFESMFLLKGRFGITFKLPGAKIKLWCKKIWNVMCSFVSKIFRKKEEKATETDAVAEQAKKSDRKVRYYIKKILFEYLGYSTPLIIIGIIVYAVSGVFVNALILGTLFTILSIFV